MVSVTKFTVQIEKSKLTFFCKMHETRHDLHLSTLIIAVHNLKIVKFIHSEKAKKICEISTIDLSYVVMVKSMVEI